MSEKTLTERIKYIRKRVNMATYINTLIPLQKHGTGLMGKCPFHDDKKPSFSVTESKQLCRCFTCMSRAIGIVDFVMKYNKVEVVRAVEILEEYLGCGTTEKQTHLFAQKQAPQPKNTKAIQAKMNKAVSALMYNHKKYEIFSYFLIENANIKEERASISPAFQKLFEHKFFVVDENIKKRLEYIRKYIAYDSFFNCPAIILRDTKKEAVDIIKYRPNKPSSWDNFTSQKYFYLKDADKLDNRGEHFLFPFSLEMNRLIEKHKFLIIGEGLKNAVVALIFGVPYVSIESSSTNVTANLKNYIAEKVAKGYKVLGAFDGDTMLKDGILMKGEGAYERAKKDFDLIFNNLFDFESGLDFADYLKNESDLREFEKKFNHLFYKYL